MTTAAADVAESPREQTAAATALLGSGAVLVWNDVEDGARDAFYEWHDHEHIPERLGIPGFRRGRRFARAGHSREWLTMYEADDLSVTTSPAYVARLNEPTAGTQSMLRHFRNTARAVCRVVHSAGSSTGGFVAAIRLDSRQPGDDVMRDVFPEACSTRSPRSRASSDAICMHRAPEVSVRDAAVYSLEICRLPSSARAKQRTIAG